MKYQLVEPIIRLKNVPNFKRILNTLPVRAKALHIAEDFQILWCILKLLPLQGALLIGIIPRALPWAMSFCPFRRAAYRSYGTFQPYRSSLFYEFLNFWKEVRFDVLEWHNELDDAPRLPFKFYEDHNAFKLFMLDVGLMWAMAEASAESILVGDNIFSEYEGAFTELYVFTQLTSQGISLYYHSVDNSTIEIDFLAAYKDHVVPIEVKAEVNVKSKSLRTFITRNPGLKGLRFSMLPYEQQDWWIGRK